MSIFDRLKGAIKGSKTAKSPSKSSAQFARSSASAAGGTANGHWTQYEIRLEEAQLGLQVTRKVANTQHFLSSRNHNLYLDISLLYRLNQLQGMVDLELSV